MNCFRPIKFHGIFCGALAASLVFAPHIFAAETPGELDGNTSPLKLYNDGTKRLREGKLQEAEACLQGAVASQNDHVQGPALYNLGHARFREGIVDLKKGPNQQAVTVRSKQASEGGTGAIQAADQALAGDDVDAMVQAYLRGRGARKELKGATEAVRSAMEIYGGVLAKWRRASGDFKSDFELAPRDIDAKTNADLVDQNIARLVDMQQMMMQMMQGMAQQRSELGKKLAELKKKMPKDKGDQMKGGSGDDDDDEEDGKKPKEPKDGMEEPSPKNGKEMMLTFEEAARLLDMLKLDGNRKLPYGTNEMARPKDRKGRDW
jgi:hypothetical protein